MKYLKLHGKYFRLQPDQPDDLQEIMNQPATETIAEQVTPDKVPDREPDQVVG